MAADRDLARRRYQAASEAEQQGDLPAAVAALTEAIALDPTRAAWHHRLGKLQAGRRRWREAVTACEAAVAREADRPKRHYWLGRARERCWDLAGAVTAYRTAVRLAPEREDWARRLAGAQQAASQFRPFTGLVVAHRGRSGPAPENVLEGLATVPECAAGVEVDVRVCRDGVPVLMHDRTVARTTDGTGAVAELTYRQVRELRGAGGARVPSLADYLAGCAGRGFRRILVDVKSATPAELAAVTEVVAGSPVAPVCVVMVREEPAVAAARRLGNGLRLGWFGTTVANLADRLGPARRHRAELLLVALGSTRYLANRAVIAEGKAAGFATGASTINTGRALEAARVDGCDLLMTDVSDQLDFFVGTGSRPATSI